MARTNIAVQQLAYLGNAALTKTAVDQPNGNRVRIKDKATRLIFDNGSASPKEITIVSVPAGPHGRSGDLVITVAAGTERVVSMLPTFGFEQGSGDDVGYVQIDYDSGTSLTVAAVEG